MQHFVFSTLILFSTMGFAAPLKPETKSETAKQEIKAENKSENKNPKLNAFKEWVKKRASVSIFFATADSMNSENYNSNSASGWSNVAASPSFGLAAQVTDKAWAKASWYANASLEQEHELSNIKTSTQTGTETLSLTAKPGFRPLLLGTGIIFQPHKIDRYYYSLGLNIPLLTDVQAGEFSSFKMRGEIGWQISAAMRLKKEMAIEAGWREIRYNTQAIKQDGTSMQFGSQNFGGVSIAARYSF